MNKGIFIDILYKFQDKILSDERCYQKYGLQRYQYNNVREVLKLIYRRFKDPQKITVLDVGCSASVALFLAKHVKKMVGINNTKYFLKSDSCPANVELLVMDARKLEFADNTFDFVYSTDVYEHLQDFSTCMDESLRVLKTDGYAYARWAPLWSGPRGHHIHDDMVRRWEASLLIAQTPYKNNGYFIEDWSHLLLSPDEMLQNLSFKLQNAALAEKITDYVYRSKDINRMFFEDYKKIFLQKKLQIDFWNNRIEKIPTEVFRKLKIKYPYNDFSLCSSEILFHLMNPQE